MKKSLTIIVLALIANLATAQTSQNQTAKPFSMEDIEEMALTEVDYPLQGPTTGLDVVWPKFVVDEDLPAPKEIIPKYDDKEIAKRIVNISAVPLELHRVVKTSFEGQQLGYIGDDNFYKCLVQAYADHHPLVLSPDMVWLIISQGFSRYVNAHAEEMRDLLVFHEGKMDLVVNSNNDVLSPSGDWELLLNDFSTCIARNTKGELADLMTADFTTSLRKYRLEKWASDLEVILKEFVKASKGHANKEFWQDIVKKRRVDRLKRDRGVCVPSINSTRLDGWFLKFFPNVLGETPDSVIWDTDMPQEIVRVSFKHIYVDPVTSEPLDTIPMQLWAGFVGVEEDATTRTLMPKIGWLARIADEESDEVARLKEEDKHMELYIHIGKDQEVPHALSKMDHIRSLRLDFWDNPVVIPEWLDKIQIDKLRIMGKLTQEEEAQLRQRFPKAEIERFEDFFKGLKQVPIKEESKEEKDVKAGDKISGTVSDEMGPLMGASVFEIDDKGQIVESAITDNNGHFIMKVRNPEDSIRFSYVGMKTITIPIAAKEYKIKLQLVSNLEDMRMRMRQTTRSNLPIPVK